MMRLLPLTMMVFGLALVVAGVYLLASLPAALIAAGVASIFIALDLSEGDTE